MIRRRGPESPIHASTSAGAGVVACVAVAGAVGVLGRGSRGGMAGGAAGGGAGVGVEEGGTRVALVECCGVESAGMGER